MKSANAIAFCQTSSFSKLNIALAPEVSQLSTNDSQLTYSFSALNARFRNEVVRDVISARRFGRCYLGIPMRTPQRDFRRRAMLRRRAFGALRENVRRMIRRARAHRCTSARQTRENQLRVQHVRAI